MPSPADFLHTITCPHRRAFLGADLVLGRLHLVKPTTAQAARLCGVSTTYVRAARRIAYCRPDLRSSTENGLHPLISPKRKLDLVEAWNAASNDERVAFAQRIGVARVFDECIAPALG
jgi:hypothetical protein